MSGSKIKSMFVYQVLCLLSLLLILAAFGGSSLVWLRQEISESAGRVRVFETDLAKLDRRFRYLEGKIAEIHQPEYLKRRSHVLGMNLVQPARSQVVRLTLPGGLEKEGSAIGGAEPLVGSFDLAFMELEPGTAAE